MMFYGQCNNCGERWELGTSSTCKCPPLPDYRFNMKDAPIKYEVTGSALVNDWVMRITADRKIEVAEDVEVTEAAKKVLEAMQQLLSAPPAREWVGLTDAEIAQGNKESWVTEQAWQSAVWWAEAKLKQKNGG